MSKKKKKNPEDEENDEIRSQTQFKINAVE